MYPSGFRGAAFTSAADGDMRTVDRNAISSRLGIGSAWATVSQVHGADVRAVASSGVAGPADAIATTSADLPLAVFTADCGGVILESPRAVAVVHAGWRGAAAGVVRRAATWMSDNGGTVRAALGPTIGPCCFEVGEEVAAEFPDHVSTTTWGTLSIDLGAVIRSQIPDVEWWSADRCTRCSEGWFSHRLDATTARLATIGWMP